MIMLVRHNYYVIQDRVTRAIVTLVTLRIYRIDGTAIAVRSVL